MHDRRMFVRSITAGALSMAAANAFALHASARQAAVRKAVLISMLPKDLSYTDRFQMARDAGFEGIEMQTVTNAEQAAEIREASQKSGLRIHSVMTRWDRSHAC